MKNLIFFIFLFIILRIPSFFEPYWYADEGIFSAVALALEKGYRLYQDVFDNRLPFIYYLYSLGNSSNRLIFVRSVNLLFGIFSVIGFFFLLRKIKIQPKKIFFLLLFFVFLLGTPLFEANIAHNEVFFLPFLIFGFYLVQFSKKWWFFLAGIFYGLAMIVKYQAVFSFLPVLIFFLLIEKNYSVVFFLISGFLIVLGGLFFLFFVSGNLKPAFEATILSNLFYASYYASYQIPLWFRFFWLMVEAGLIFYFLKKRKIEKKTALIFLLLIADFWSAIFPGRKYLHYLIQIIPSLVLVLAIITSLRKNRYLKIFLLVFIVCINLKIFYQGAGEKVKLSPFSYYRNFFSYLFKKPQTNSLSFTFGRPPEILTELEKYSYLFLKKKVFFAANIPWAYDIFQIPPCCYFVTYYHVFMFPKGEEKLISFLEKERPEIIIVEKNQFIFDVFNKLLKRKYRLIKQTPHFLFYSIKSI